MPSTARVSGAAVHFTATLPQAARPRVMVARPAGRPAGPSTGLVRGTLIRSTAPAPTFPNPQAVGPAMYVARNAHSSQVGPRR